MEKSLIRPRLRSRFRMPTTKLRLETGFSMLEAVVVVGVLLALAVGGFLSYGPIVTNAKTAAAKSHASQVYTAVMVALSDGDPNTNATDTVDDFNSSDSEYRAELSAPADDPSVAAMTTAAYTPTADSDFCLTITHKSRPSIFAQMGNCPVANPTTPTPTPTPTGPDTDSDGIPDATDPDIDNDGIPNAEDRDANGDGVRDDYVPGGAITEPDGESYPYAGSFSKTVVGDSGKSVFAYFNSNATPQAQRLAAHFIATCVRPDGSEYEVNGINGFNSSTTAQTNTSVQFSNCSPNRVYSYVIKPVTKEAMASGKISNPDFFGGYTFSGGYRWSEPDGYIVTGAYLSSSSSGPSVSASYKPESHPQIRRLAIQYEATCVKPDKSNYKKTGLAGTNSVANSSANIGFTVVTCNTGDLVRDYKIYPVKTLGTVSNPDFFGGYTMSGGTEWVESINGYPTGGTINSATMNTAKTSLAVSMTVDAGHGIKRFAIQYKLTCLNSSGSEYKVNNISIFNSRNPSEGLYSATLSCSGNRITSSEISPVNDLRSASDPSGFGGWTLTGTHNWAG